MKKFAATAEMSVFYADASALVKFIRKEPESTALHAYLEGVAVVSCELALVEIPRAAHRIAAQSRGAPLEHLLIRAAQLIDKLALHPLDPALLAAAGVLAEPMLRTLDAIHVAAALHLSPVDAFVTYDKRQAAAARLAGLRTVAPGA